MEQGRIWHVTLTVGGAVTSLDEISGALGRLAAEQPFLVGARYSDRQVELDYWEEAHDCVDAAALALRLWGEHRASAALPAWGVLGVEVVEQDTFEGRARGSAPVAAFVPALDRPAARLRAVPSA